MTDELSQPAPDEVSPAATASIDPADERASSPSDGASSRRVTRREGIAQPRRLVAGALIVAGVVGATLLAETPESVSNPAAAASEAIALPPDQAISAAWYCPGGLPGNPGQITRSTGDDDAESTDLLDTVFVTNTSERNASVRITTFSAAARPATRPIAVASGEVVELAVSDLSDEPDAAVMVETFTEGIVVEQQVGAADRDDVAVGPCATQTSSRWYFAAGSTAKDSTQWLSLLNPFSQDAVVDVTVIANDTVRHPSDLQSLVIPARSRRSVFVNDAADRKQIVSLVIESELGDRIVAQQTVVHRGSGRRFGVSSTIGAVAPVRRATFAGGDARADTTRLLYIMNPASVSTDVDILVTAPGVAPTTLELPPESVVAVNINKIAPRDAKYALIVEATAGFGEDPDVGRGVVVEDFEGWRIELSRRSVFGVAGGSGLVAPSDEWRFGLSELDAESRGQLMVYNPNGSAVTVDVAFVVDGELVRPSELQDVEIEGSTQLDIRLDTVIEEPVGLIVTASEPVYVERRLNRAESLTRSTGIPRRD